MNLRLRSNRALSFLSSRSSLNNLSSKAAAALALSVSGFLALGVSFGMHAESRHAAVSPQVTHAAAMNPSLRTFRGAGQVYELRMHHLHTGENIDVVYRVGNHYIPGAIAELNHFLRDHRTEAVSHYDPREFDVLHSVLARLRRPNSVIDVVCGYRSPWSNNYLRTRSADTGVAKNSQHMQAKAIDIRVPGVATARLRDAALSLRAGGVGYYPVSQFVHVDVGPVRHWTFAGGE